MHRELTTIQERGAGLAFIGNGNRHHARAFADGFEIEAPLYVDTERASYRALEMRRGFRATLGSRASLSNMRRALKAGFRQGLTRGDAWQLGGVVVVAPSGAVLYSHRSEAAGDKAPVAAILASLERA